MVTWLIVDADLWDHSYDDAPEAREGAALYNAMPSTAIRTVSIWLPRLNSATSPGFAVVVDVARRHLR
jgi:hypothetical protein